MVKTTLFLWSIILKKVIVNCETKVVNLLIQLELEEILAKSLPILVLFILNDDQILYTVVTCSFVII